MELPRSGDCGHTFYYSDNFFYTPPLSRPPPLDEILAIIRNPDNYHKPSSEPPPPPADAGSSAPIPVPSYSKKGKNPVVDERSDDEDGALPPHEYLKKNGYGQSPRVAHSMIEGAGRTLKGRDLFEFRDAVLRKTGFYEN